MAWYDNLSDATEVSTDKNKTSNSSKDRSIGDYAIDMTRAGMQGVTRGYGDEMEAGARALYQKFVDGKDFSTAYNETVKEIRGDIKSRSEERRVVKECRSRWSAYH